LSRLGREWGIAMKDWVVDVYDVSRINDGKETNRIWKENKQA